MSELEPSTETARPESPNIPAPGDNSNSNSAPDTPTAAITLPPVQNGVDSSPATAQPVASSIKRFSSANITKKFLQKAGPSLNTSASPPAVSSTSPSPVPTKTAPSLASKLSSTSNAPRLFTTKLTQTPTSSISKWSKDPSSDNAKAGASGSDTPSNKSALQPGKGGQATKDRTSLSPGRPVWGSVAASAIANARVQNDFPTAAEIKDRADKAAATTAAQRRSLDAFRGVHLDPKAQHWDEMTEEEDFLSGVIEFGDGKQYTVAPAAEVEPGEPQPADPSEDRLGNDYDRSWPASRENGAQNNISPSSSFKGSNATHERVLFNDRHNRMETLQQARQPPTLLNSTQPGARGPGLRRESNGRGFRDSPGWNPPSHRGGHPSDSTDRESDGRGRRTSFAEKDKPPHSQGGLGPYLRDRSPDRSGRFPGRNIPITTRRDSQASSAIVASGPARSTRALSRESSDRGGGRQLPPHLSPVMPSSTTSSIPPRTSWRDSPTNVRPPSSALSHPRPMSMASDGSHQPPGSENGQLVSPGGATVPPAEAAAVAALVQDEEAFKASMNVAAERARKRRQEEEEQREKERERAKAKLAELEKKLQADKEAKETKEREEKEKAERDRAQKEEEERQVKLKAEREKSETERKDAKAMMGGKERGGPQARPFPAPRPSDIVDSWRSPKPVLATNVSSQVNSDSKRSPTAILKPRPHDPPAIAPPAHKEHSIDLTGKPANAGLIPEVVALHSKDHDVEVLDFADLHQLAEGYAQSQLAKTVPQVNGLETSNKPHVENSKGFTRSDGKYSRSQPPAPLNLPPRGLQDQSLSYGPHSASYTPGSAGLGSARSPRDPNHTPYRQAPISVLDDTLSRFKQAIEHSNPAHAGMSSDDIMQGLAEAGKTVTSQLPAVQVSKAMFSNEPDQITGEPAWSQTQILEEEEVDAPNVLIPTLSLRRKVVSFAKKEAMRQSIAWRWDCLTFDPPVPFMNRRTLSVIDTLIDPSMTTPGRLRIKIPGSPMHSVPYSEPSQKLPTNMSRPRREDLRVNAPPMLQSTTNGITAPPKTAPSTSQWPPKSKGAEDLVWRRAVPVTAVPEQAATVVTIAVDTPAPPLTAKSVPDAKHNRTLSVPMSSSPARTPPVTVNSIAATTWGRSPLSLTVTDTLPEDPSLKAAWNKASSAAELKPTKNSLMDIADEPVPHIPSSISEVRSEDGDMSKMGEKEPPARQKYNPHTAFQQVSTQPPLPQTASPVVNPSSLSSTQPTPRSNALALTTNRTPRQPTPSSLPHIPLPVPQNMPQNPPRPGYPQSMAYSSPMLPMASPYSQPMMVTPQYGPPTPVMAPPTPGMMHRSSTPSIPMQPPMQGTPLQAPMQGVPMWGQQPPPPGPPGQMGYMRQMQAPLPPPVQYQPQMVHQSPSLQLYMQPQPGMMHPPSPALSPMAPPGMNKAMMNGQRPSNPNMPGGAMQPNSLPVSMPMTFQVPPPQVPPQQMGYMMHSPMQAPGTPQQQFNPQMRPPQGRGMPMHPPQYPTPAPPPSGFPRPW